MTKGGKDLVREWMDMFASGPAEAWTGRVADDVVIRLPYAPPPVATEVRGIKQAIATMEAHWGAIERFEWRDVVIRGTDEPGLFVTTARSEVLYRSGRRYANEYVVLTRIRDGLIVEHAEYFNPLPVLAMFEAN